MRGVRNRGGTDSGGALPPPHLQGGHAGAATSPCVCVSPFRHIFLGFSKCGRYVLSYTSSSGDDDFSFYIYHLYWWEFNVHSKLKLVLCPPPAPDPPSLPPGDSPGLWGRPPSLYPLPQVRQVRLFQDEEIYSDLYLTVCEWPSDSSKVIVFGFK